MAVKQKMILVICDGVGDRPSTELDGKTPLQAAKLPNLDRLAEMGQCGIVDTIAPGIRPGSDTSHLALLGYDPYEVYTGRGPFEAAGEAMDIKTGDIAFRCNFGTVDGEFNVLDRRAGRIKEGTGELAAAIDGMEIEGVKIMFKAAVEHRAVLVLRGAGLGAGVSETDPHETGKKILAARALESDARLTARVLNKLVRQSYELLDGHPVNEKRRADGKPPANMILARGAGAVPVLQGFQAKYGMTGACVVGISLVKGVCRLAGMDVVDVPGATGGTDTDVDAKAKAALAALADHDFVLVNVKMPDLFGHDCDPEGKAKSMERIDGMMGTLLDGMPEGTVLAVTGDHSTPATVGDHTADPLPLAIYCKGGRRDGVAAFDEMSCASGGLGRLTGKDVLPVMMDLANRSAKFGA